jgi:DNA-binding NarL/FixJ family response regulator
MWDYNPTTDRGLSDMEATSLKPAIKVFLIEDHNLVRAGIKSLLAQLQGVEVAGEAGNGRDALRMMKEEMPAMPDIVLTDIAMAGLNGMETTARITKDFPNVRVIVLSMYANEEYVMQALRAGAAGYLVKEAATSELELAIRAVARGDTYLSPAVSGKVIDKTLGRIVPQNSPLERLTPRQREILQLIAEGRSTKQIADTLKLSVKTVETHRAQLMSRLEIFDVPGLVRYAIRVGMISSDL